MRLILFIFLVPALAAAQIKSFDTQKIEVWGNAEKIIVPNEIFTSITIKEYKAPGKKITLDKLEEQLVKAVAAEKIPKENLRVENIYGFN
jgi:antitoxin component of MazEF toxin-antitoxin module